MRLAFYVRLQTGCSCVTMKSTPFLFNKAVVNMVLQLTSDREYEHRELREVTGSDTYSLSTDFRKPMISVVRALLSTISARGPSRGHSLKSIFHKSLNSPISGGSYNMKHKMYITATCDFIDMLVQKEQYSPACSFRGALTLPQMTNFRYRPQQHLLTIMN